jgi:glycine cleavage system H lipoate-binding protein
VDCPVYQQQGEDALESGHCPFLDQRLVQYCSAASITKFIPYSESVLSRCGSEAYRYCDVFASLANPAEPGSIEGWSVEGIEVPPKLFYSPNHMWLELGEDGRCHIGIDGLLAKALGRVDGVSFLALKGPGRPTAVLTVRGVDMPMVFPNQVLLAATNLYLRANPAKLTDDPYRLGWLFEAAEPPPSAGKPGATPCTGLIRGREAAAWMREEVCRVRGFVREWSPGPEQVGVSAGRLGHEEMLRFYSEFLSPCASWTR